MIAGPPTSSALPPSCLVRINSSATYRIATPFGFSVVPFMILAGLVVLGVFANWEQRVDRLWDGDPDGQPVGECVAASVCTGRPASWERAMTGAASGTTGERSVSIEKVGTGDAPPPNEAAPHSDTAPAGGSPFTQPPATATPDPNELKPTPAPSATEPQPNSQPDPNELKPNAPDPQAAGEAALPPPPQVNEIQQGQSSSSASASSTNSAPASDQEISSSKKKKKKGLKKIVPF